MAVLVLTCIACSPRRRHTVVAFNEPPPTSVDAGLSIRDRGPLSIVDVGSLDATPDASYGMPLQWNNQVLLLDMSMSSPTGWTQLFESSRNAAVDIVYRAHLPYLTASDVDGRYGGIVLALGNGPEEPEPYLRADTIDYLQTFLGRGGSLMVLTRHSWQDSMKGSHDRALINGLLEQHSGRVRIDANTMFGEYYGPNSDGSQSTHTSLPWAYVTPSDPTRGGAIGFIRHPERAQHDTPFALGLAASLSCESASIGILAESHIDAESWTTLSEATRPSTLQKRPVAVQLKLINGQILLASRSIFNLPFHLAKNSIQPILEPQLADGTKIASDWIFSNWARAAQTGEIIADSGCFVSSDSGANPSSHEDINPIQDTPPTKDDPPESFPWARVPDQQPVNVSTPEWAAPGPIRLVSGNLPTEEAFNRHLDRARLAKMQGYIATITASALMTYAESEQHSQRLLRFGQASQEKQQLAFVSTRFANALYNHDAETYGQVVGPNAHEIQAPPPLSEQWWQLVIRPMILSAAQLSALSPGITGLVLDLNLEQSPTGHYDRNHAFDNETWSIILDAIEVHDPSVSLALAQLPTEERMNGLLDFNLMAFAYERLEQETARRVRLLLDESRDINPQFELLLKSSAVQHSWFYRGFYRGVGRPDRPAVLLSYSCCQPKAIADLQSWGYSVIGLSGLLTRRLQPADVHDALLNAAADSHGYWIAHFEDFEPDSEAVLDRYWSAFLRANSQLAPH